MRRVWLESLGNVVRTGAAKDHNIQQGVSAQTVGAVHGHRGRLASSPQARHNLVLAVLRVSVAESGRGSYAQH